MQPKILIAPALFSAISIAQINNIDTVEAARGATDQANFFSSLATNAAFSSNILALASAIPTSIISQAQNNPASFANALQTGTAAPAWVSAIPTPVLNSLNTLLAIPDRADDDANAIATGPQASAVFANPAIPTSVRAAFTSDPVGFIEDILTATTWPAWATSIPGPLQTQVGQIINQELSTFVADFESTYATSSATRSRPGTGASSSYRRTSASSGFAAPTSGRPFFPTASGKAACPTCSSCSPVTVVVTVTSGSLPVSSKPASIASSVPALSALSKPAGTAPSSSRASTGFPKSSLASIGLASKATIASGGLPAPAVPSAAKGTAPGVSSATKGTAPSLSSTTKGTASTGVVAFTGTKTGAPLAFTGAAAPMRAVGLGAAVMAGVGGLMNL